MLNALAASPGLFITVVGILGLLVGSFLNVVILRLPRKLEQQWRSVAADILEQPARDKEHPVDLVRSRSACPTCGAAIPAWQNIPVISFVLLRGRCAQCKARISWQYPLVELLTAATSAVIAWQFGYGVAAGLALLLSWALIALAGIDARTQFLPDILTLPLLWLGLLASLHGDFTDPVSAIIGAAAGYLILWLVYHGFRLATGKEGMGYGDFKLLAAIGAWLGWQMLPEVILLSSLAGVIIGIAMRLTGALGRGKPMPFGPYLAIAGWLVLVAGDTITSAYFQLFAFNS